MLITAPIAPAFVFGDEGRDIRNNDGAASARARAPNAAAAAACAKSASGGGECGRYTHRSVAVSKYPITSV